MKQSLSPTALITNAIIARYGFYLLVPTLPALVVFMGAWCEPTEDADLTEAVSDCGLLLYMRDA